MMLKASLVVLLAGVSGSEAFFAPAPVASRAPRAGRALAMSGKAQLDTLPRVVLADDATGHSATVHLHGGCVTSYKAPHEVLAVRKDAAFDGSKPIAGGLQICWPQFGAGAIQQHGFARNLPWEVASHSATEPEATLVLKASDATRKVWDQDFELHLTVRLEADHLLTRLTAKNTGAKAWDFTGALHSYYGVSDVSQASIAGVQGATFVDKTKDPFETVTLPPAELGIEQFLEGVLPDLKGPVSLSDKGRRVRTAVTHTKGWNDYILWAPVGNDAMGYKRFVCVESGAVSKPVTVAPGSEWVGEMKISSRSG